MTERFNNIPPYKQDIVKGELCYYKETEHGFKARPIMEVDGRLVYLTPRLIREKEAVIELQKRVRPSAKIVWNPFWGEDARWE